jgi:hypothetical protein
LIGVQALNEAVSEFYSNSFDLDFTERAADVNTVSGTPLLTSPTGNSAWDSNVIKSIKYQRTGNDFLSSLVLTTLEDAENLKLQTFTENIPQFWYVNQSSLYIIPTPTQVYSLKVFYQSMQPDITSSNITDTIVLPASGLDALTSGVYAQLRRAAGDPEWGTYHQIFDKKLYRYFQRNKHTYKRKGFQLIRMKFNTYDRTL